MYELGLASLKSVNDIYLFSGANLLQDAVEAFLVGVADFVGVALDEKTHFDKYFVLINEKIAPKKLPFKNQLLRLNRIRVGSKHHGIQPARDECQRLVLAVREFFDEVSSSVLAVNFATVSTIDLLTEGEAKDQLLSAKNALDSGDLPMCAISCRKAIFLELERWYDVSEFKDGAERGGLGPITNAPFFARNKDYIEKYVKEPTDYIVYDHSDLDQKLLKYAVDNTAFWNVWRLTPKVYRTKNKEWIVKYDFEKLDTETLKANIEYIFNTTVDIIIAIHSKKESIKQSTYQRYSVELKQEEVPVYEKADINSRVIGRTPKGLTQMDCDFRVPGFRGDGPYWHIHDLEHGYFLYGFIHDNDLKHES
ncbi:MAG: hypothetical protein KGJ87_07965 [Planctomycetota bacterium]|nr:hypothetical protein [Planctomycetota bacterium]MDE1889975.1 hypothetical protein [Planctomycetota bacterium]MDE2217076.1 hypothetical protein [Planctomycetota bacterium]